MEQSYTLNVKKEPMNNTLEDWLKYMKKIDCETVPADIPTDDAPDAKEDTKNDYLVNKLQQENEAANYFTP